MVNAPSRKLAVILHADVVGSTTLVQKNESLTHERIRLAFLQLSKITGNYGGTAHEIRGDALVAEFSRASDAVCAAFAFQAWNTKTNAELHDDIRPQIRIGISLAEVVIADGTVTGAGVILAQRLEQLAEAGGVVVQGSVSETVPTRLPFEFESLGEHSLKGFDQPVRAFVTRLKPDANIPKPDFTTPDVQMNGADADTVEGRPPLELPDKPSIAVLPFTNMSGDPEQEYFSDGITEDIITTLSKISSLVVIASNSTFTYKGKAVDVKEVGREQSVRYIVEGSVRKASGRVRVTAQLIDAISGHHIWAERYDRDLEDIFAVQDEITREIVVALDVKLREGEQSRLWASGTRNFEAWECMRLGTDQAKRAGLQHQQQAARSLFRKAVEIDPQYAVAWAMLGWTYYCDADVATGIDNVEDRKTALASAMECGRKALELDPSCSDAYAQIAMCHLATKEFDDAIKMSDLAVAMAPSNAENLATAALIMIKSGKPERGLEITKKAMRLCPLYRAGFLDRLGMAHRLTGDLEGAVRAYRESVIREPEFLGSRVNLASTLGELGRVKEARTEAGEVLRLEPNFSIKAYVDELSYRDPSDVERIAEGLRIAGLPK